MNKQTFKIFPVGKVEQIDGKFQLRIFEPYISALDGLEDFSHVVVLWWSHMLDSSECRQSLVCKKPYKKGPEKIGTFATRSPARPNPIALSVTDILKVEKINGVIKVSWIDAEPDTPIIDLKPYYPCSDRVKEVTVPKWCKHWPQWYEESGEFDWASEMIY